MILQRMGDKCVHSLLLVLEIVKSHHTDSDIKMYKNIVKVLSLGCLLHLHYARQTHNSKRNQLLGLNVFLSKHPKRGVSTHRHCFFIENQNKSNLAKTCYSKITTIK